MFRNELTLLKLENKKQLSELREDDKNIIKDVMKSMSIFKVNSYDAQVVRRDLIGMAQEQKLRGSSLKNSIGDDLSGFTNEIIKNSGGPSIREILLRFLAKLSGYFFAWFLLSAFLLYGGLSWESSPIIYPFYVGIVIIAFIAEGIIAPIFCGEEGLKKNLQSLISLLVIAVWSIINYWLRDIQYNIEVNGGMIIIASGLIYLVTRYLISINIRKLAKDKYNFINDLI